MNSHAYADTTRKSAQPKRPKARRLQLITSDDCSDLKKAKSWKSAPKAGEQVALKKAAFELSEKAKQFANVIFSISDAELSAFFVPAGSEHLTHTQKFILDFSHAIEDSDEQSDSRSNIVEMFLLKEGTIGLLAFEQLIPSTDIDVACPILEYLGSAAHTATKFARKKLLERLLKGTDSAIRATAALSLANFASDLSALVIEELLQSERNSVVQDSYRCLLNEMRMQSVASAGATN